MAKRKKKKSVTRKTKKKSTKKKVAKKRTSTGRSKKKAAKKKATRKRYKSSIPEEYRERFSGSWRYSSKPQTKAETHCPECLKKIGRRKAVYAVYETHGSDYPYEDLTIKSWYHASCVPEDARITKAPKREKNPGVTFTKTGRVKRHDEELDKMYVKREEPAKRYNPRRPRRAFHSFKAPEGVPAGAYSPKGNVGMPLRGINDMGYPYTLGIIVRETPKFFFVKRSKDGPTKKVSKSKGNLSIPLPPLKRKRPRRRWNPDTSPGNFRSPTVAQSRQHLDWWKRQGITSANQLRRLDYPSAKERRLDQIRYREADHIWNKYQRELADPSTPKPVYTYPRGNDYGDFMPVSEDQSRSYLRGFYTRQRSRIDKGLPLQSVTEYPFKPRYDEAVEMIGQREADSMAKRIMSRHNYDVIDFKERKYGVPFRRRRRNPFLRSRRRRRRWY